VPNDGQNTFLKAKPQMSESDKDGEARAYIRSLSLWTQQYLGIYGG